MTVGGVSAKWMPADSWASMLLVCSVMVSAPHPSAPRELASGSPRRRESPPPRPTPMSVRISRAKSSLQELVVNQPTFALEQVTDVGVERLSRLAQRPSHFGEEPPGSGLAGPLPSPVSDSSVAAAKLLVRRRIPAGGWVSGRTGPRGWSSDVFLERQNAICSTHRLGGWESDSGGGPSKYGQTLRMLPSTDRARRPWGSSTHRSTVSSLRRSNGRLADLRRI